MSGSDTAEPIELEIKTVLGHSPDFICRDVIIQGLSPVSCMYMATISDSSVIDEFIVKPIIEASLHHNQTFEDTVSLLRSSIPLPEMKHIATKDEAVINILEGNCVIFDPSSQTLLAYCTVKNDYRTITEPSSEAVIRGPREGFLEDIQSNVALIRKRLKSPNLIFEEFTIGSETKTTVYMAYLTHTANEALVKEFRCRISAIETDSILESAYMEEWIQDKTFSPFPQVLSTERPDAIVAKLLEGQVAVLTNGTPMVLAGPVTFFQLFSSPEDYYQRADIATLLRWLRMLSFLLAIFIPALYIAVVSFHQELLPTPLLINLAAQREEVPFPAVVEALIMIITFEILREAGLRMPRIAGQAISIVGALVIGQAAVEAGLVSAAMVIVVSLTAISNFISPMYGFGIAQRIIQFACMLLSGVMGLFGLMCGVFFLLIHLVSIRSFGVKYMTPLAPVIVSDWKDTLVRIPRNLMKRQPRA